MKCFYCREAYGKTIREHRQPLLINRPKKKDRNGRVCVFCSESFHKIFKVN